VIVRLKSGTITVKVTVAVCVSEPLVPVMVIVELPVGVELPVVMLSVELPDVLTEAGENEAFAPAGKPLAVKPTDPVNPFCAPIVTV
jgi:hypothetical protein